MNRNAYSLPCRDVAVDIRDAGLARQVQNLIRQWALPLLEANPAMIEMLRDRDERPYRSLLPWSGEFIGKHLTACAELYLLTRDAELGDHIRQIASALAEVQAPDGYIGPWATPCQLTGAAPNSHYDHDVLEQTGQTIPTWDTWGAYHLILGLVTWHRAEPDPAALRIAERLADLLCDTFYGPNPPLSSIGTTETNLAVVHAMALLHQVTGNDRYLRFAEAVAADFEAPNAGHYLRLALSGKHFFEMPIPRWESLHPVMGLAALYEITGNEDHRRAFERIWWSIAETDRHNTGGFSSGESACGDPYDPRPIETCCTVAWMALSVEMLKLTGDAVVADELELSFLNAGLGALSPSGRWCTYNTPMDGHRWSSLAKFEIAFQSRPGSPELNCCSVNAPRAVGLLSQWAATSRGDAVTVNYYGGCAMDIRLEGGGCLRMVQHTAYPLEPAVAIRICQAPDREVALRLRIPQWSKSTRLLVNGAPVDAVPGRYATVRRVWKPGDEVRVVFDFTLHAWAGERELAGRACLYRGPVLLALDGALNEDEAAAWLSKATPAEIASGTACAGRGYPGVLYRVETADGAVTLCDFRSAGYTGRPYRTWFPLEGIEQVPFSRENTFRSAQRGEQSANTAMEG